jgi:hypothetical protein
MRGKWALSRQRRSEQVERKPNSAVADWPAAYGASLAGGRWTWGAQSRGRDGREPLLIAPNKARSLSDFGAAKIPASASRLSVGP